MKDKLKKTLRLLLLAVALAIPMAITAYAGSGSGTKDDPYVPTSYNDLVTYMQNAPTDGKRYIKLKSSISSTDSNNNYYIGTYKSGQSFELDLNGCNITRTPSITADSGVINLGYGNLVIRDTKGGGTISGNKMFQVGLMYVYGNGNLEIYGGKFVNEAYGKLVLLTMGGTTKIYGGEFFSNQGSNIKHNYGDMFIYGGEFCYTGELSDRSVSVLQFSTNKGSFEVYNCHVYCQNGVKNNIVYTGGIGESSSTNLWDHLAEDATITLDGEVLERSDRKGLYGIDAVITGSKTIRKAAVTVKEPIGGAALSDGYRDLILGSNDYSCSSIAWHLVEDGQLKSFTAFEEGKRYMCHVELTPNSGTRFPSYSSGVFSGDMRGNFNGETLDTTTGRISGNDSGTRLGMTRFFTVNKTIPWVTVRMTEPEAGLTPNDITIKTIAENTDQASVTIDSWRMWDPSTKTYEEIFSDTEFEAGKQYEPLIHIKAKDGYVFNGSFTLYVNNHEPSEYTLPNRKGFTIYEKFIIPEANKIPAVYINVEEPVIGEVCQAPTIVGNRVCFFDAEWQDNSDSHILETGVETFKPGHSYRLNMIIYPTDSSESFITLSDVNQDRYKITMVYVNDDATGVSAKHDSINANVQFDQLPFKKIDTVSIAPAGRGNNTYTYPIGKAVEEVIPQASDANAGYEIDPDSVEWSRNVVNSQDEIIRTYYMDPGEKFEADTSYTVIFEIVPKDGYQFSDTVTNTGYQFDVLSQWSGGIRAKATVKLSKTDDVVGKHYIKVADLIAGKEYNEGDNKPVIKNTNPKVSIYKYWWTGLSSGDLNVGDKVGYGQDYYLYIVLKANDGCTFSKSTYMDINGIDTFPSGTYNGDESMRIFKYHIVMPKLIKILSFKIDEPVPGGKPDFDWEVSNTSGVEISNIVWTDYTDFHSMTADETFKAGVEYQAGFYFNLKDGYTFPYFTGGKEVPYFVAVNEHIVSVDTNNIYNPYIDIEVESDNVYNNCSYNTVLGCYNGDFNIIPKAKENFIFTGNVFYRDDDAGTTVPVNVKFINSATKEVVYDQNFTKFTHESGGNRYIFDTTSIPTGTYDLVISKDGYDTIDHIQNYEFLDDTAMGFSVEKKTGSELMVNVTSFGESTGENSRVDASIKPVGGSTLASASLYGNSTSFKFTGLANGDYEVEISKANHVTRTYTFTVNGDTEVEAKICLKGDVNRSGTITALDANQIRQYIVKSRTFDSYQVLLADVNGSSSVTALDASWIRQRVTGIRNESYEKIS